MAVFGDSNCLDSSHMTSNCYEFLHKLLERVTQVSGAGAGRQPWAALGLAALALAALGLAALPCALNAAPPLTQPLPHWPLLWPRPCAASLRGPDAGSALAACPSAPARCVQGRRNGIADEVQKLAQPFVKGGELPRRRGDVNFTEFSKVLSTPLK